MDITPAYVIERLEDAGKTLLAMPGRVGPARLSAQSYGYVAELCDGMQDVRPIRLMPDRDAIGRMDEAMAWLSLVKSSPVVRRLVASRSLVHPISGRHLFKWTTLGKLLGADVRALRRWHAQGIAEIVIALEQSA